MQNYFHQQLLWLPLVRVMLCHFPEFPRLQLHLRSFQSLTQRNCLMKCLFYLPASTYNVPGAFKAMLHKVFASIQVTVCECPSPLFPLAYKTHLFIVCFWNCSEIFRCCFLHYLQKWWCQCIPSFTIFRNVERKLITPFPHFLVNGIILCTCWNAG